MEDNVLNFKEALIAQLTDYLMVARIDQDDEGNDIAIGGGYYSVADLMTLLNTIEVEDNLTSVNTVTALSANQGRLLKAMIDAKVSSTLLGVADGVATLGSDGKVPTAQLPSYVDDVIEYTNLASFPTTGETDKIYVALDTNKTYRWGGSAYVEISPSLAIGEVTGTAYDGAKGKANADNIATLQTKKADIEQEDWIEPTLLNGWEQSGNNTVAYYKDALGVVHLKGLLISTNSVSGTCLQLPSGYMFVNSLKGWSVACTSPISIRSYITSSGLLVLVGYNAGSSVYLDGISFRAEA